MVCSLYQGSPPYEAQRLAQRIERHYIPNHGSWLNMAQTELSKLVRQCLYEPMETQHHIKEQARAWQQRRNAAKVRMEWCFGAQEAHCKLKEFFPK